MQILNLSAQGRSPFMVDVYTPSSPLPLCPTSSLPFPILRLHHPSLNQPPSASCRFFPAPRPPLTRRLVRRLHPVPLRLSVPELDTSRSSDWLPPTTPLLPLPTRRPNTPAALRARLREARDCETVRIVPQSPWGAESWRSFHRSTLDDWGVARVFRR